MNTSDVLIIGGGLAGISAALVLADRGAAVTLVEKNAAIGGYFPLLEKQFPTNSCGVCFLSPKPPAYCPYIECGLRDNITILENAEVDSLQGEDGDFTVTVNVKSNCVDNTRCINCAKCSGVCPVEVPHEFGDGMEMRKAVYKYYPQMTFRSYCLDQENCTRCNACVTACPTGAISLDAATDKSVIHAKKCILSSGFTRNTSKINAGYGLGSFKDVVSSVQFERLISTSGPGAGVLRKPSDSSVPSSIAFLQCVGSRAVKKNGNPYCSSVCCMISVKQALLAKERHPGLKIKIFYMDIRSFGKGFEEYVNKARDTEGIEFVREHITSLREFISLKKTRIAYSREGKPIEEDFDMVVLSLGFQQTEATAGLITRLGIAANRYGFALTEEFNPNATSKKGIFAAGAVTGPKDIMDATMEGASTAALVLESLALKEPFSIPKAGGSIPEQPRTGVLFCSCGDPVDETILASCKNFKEVVWTGTIELLCIEPKRIEDVKKIIADNALNRMVVAGCSVRELEVVFNNFFTETGYSKLDFEFVNIRDLLSFHSVETAQQMLVSAIVKLKNNTFSPPVEVSTTQRVLIIGGGAAGLTAALRCARQGFPVTLVEKETKLGGRLNNACYSLKGSNIRKNLTELMKQAEGCSDIEIYTSAGVVDFGGTTGNRTARIKTKDEEIDLNCGAVILAAGGTEAVTLHYGYGTSDKIITQSELERKIGGGEIDTAAIRRVVMIQCVDSREPGKREYCSRVCCTHALKNILKLKEENERIEISVLYRDMQSYGFYEDYYKQVREMGVFFFEYEIEEKPEVKVSGNDVTVSFRDHILQAMIVQNADLLVLSTGITAADTVELSRMLDIDTDSYGFFNELNKKTGLVRSVHKDIFFCGLCHGPKHIEESIVQAGAAAAHACVFLSQQKTEIKEHRAFVINRFCSGCGICVEVCPYSARIMNSATNIAEVIDHVCEGCGGCISACPNGAAEMYGYEKGQILEFVDQLCEY